MNVERIAGQDDTVGAKKRYEDGFKWDAFRKHWVKVTITDAEKIGFTALLDHGIIACSYHVFGDFNIDCWTTIYVDSRRDPLYPVIKRAMKECGFERDFRPYDEINSNWAKLDLLKFAEVCVIMQLGHTRLRFNKAGDHFHWKHLNNPHCFADFFGRPCDNKVNDHSIHFCDECIAKFPSWAERRRPVIEWHEKDCECQYCDETAKDYEPGEDMQGHDQVPGWCSFLK